ncbi:helix-turn-helix domain-containing protein [Paenibacillus sp. FSL H7-0331]|uniref:helix-turn-helix domain-containing protein n=1 Tax=Paenibacillus sp. FSL H7-0331 TaxID=1920421 RepID=UPI00096E8C8B|nr:helix-turn-helix domain-containing protein [Paenibacillus sp. FSL H7-0331]OMF07437.1 AraC family transcriptional regulator [Paenibacillus sp. FSL H7-0331]
MIQSLKKWLKYNLANTQIRLILILTVSVFLIILAVSLTSYYTSKSVLQEELSEPQHQMLQLNMNVIDDSIKESDQIAIKVAVNGNIYKFLTNEVQNSYANISELYQLLSTLIGSSKYVKSIYVYDIARSSFIALPQGYSSSKLMFVDSEWVSVAGEFGDKMTLIKKRQVPEGAGGKGSDITLFRKIVIQGEFKGIIAVNLKDEDLFAKLNPPVMNNLNRMRYIIDEHDEVLYSVSNYAFDQEGIRQALSALKEDGSSDITYQNRELLVNQLKSPVTGWKYVSIVVQDSLLAKSKKVRNTVLLVSIAALGLGGVTIFYINAAAFRPVRRLRQLFSAYDGKSSSSERIDLEKLAGELLSNHAHLAQLVQESMSEASSKLLHDIYTGNLTGKRDIKEKWSRYFGKWTMTPVTVAILSIDRYEAWSQTFSDGDRSLLKFAVANIVAELFEPQCRIVCADFGKDKTAILLQPHVAGSQLKGKLVEAIEVVSRLLKFSVSVGVSTAQTDITRLKQAMLEAENALTYRLYQGYGQVILFHEVSGHEVTESLPMESVLNELTHAIEAGDEIASLEAVDLIITHIRSQYEYPSAAISFLQATAERIAQVRPAEEGVFEQMYERFDTLHIQDIQNELNTRVIPLAQRFRRLIESKDFIVCQRMIDYMKQHLSEPIGIPEIVESIGISSSLASQVFKQEMGETIYNYLTQLRMERAAELLLKTEWRISEIAVMVGYQHENSFIRSFRKFKDITPGKYREMMRIRMDSLLE